MPETIAEYLDRLTTAAVPPDLQARITLRIELPNGERYGRCLPFACAVDDRLLRACELALLSLGQALASRSPV